MEPDISLEMDGNMKKGNMFKVLIESGIIVILILAVVLLAQDIKRQKEEIERKQCMQETKVVLYEGPKSLRDATEEDLKNASEKGRSMELLHCTDTKLTVNGEECYVYDTNVNHTRQWVSNYLPPQSRTPVAYFDFEGMVQITVTVPNRELESVRISPLSYGIKPVVDKENKTVTFTISKPDTYTVTFHDSPERAIHIFANALETDVPDFEDENVIYIGPGEWDIESIVLESGQTLYLSGGAVVHGVVNANFAHDITVMGRGIIDGSCFEGWKGQNANIPLKFDYCSNITIKDVLVLNSNAWVCQAYNSSDGIIDGLKIISSRPNGDGITLQSCQNYEVKNCFVRSWDDSLVIKNYDKNSENISFRNIQLWTDLAQSMEVGYETNKGNKEGSYIRNITFGDICVLNNFHKPVISVHNADDAAVEDILFENIVVENEQVGNGDGDEMPYLIDLNIAQNGNWSTTKERGTISNITIRNVDFLKGIPNASRIQGYDREHKVENVMIENLTMFGRKISDLQEGNFLIDEETTSDILVR